MTKIIDDAQLNGELAEIKKGIQDRTVLISQYKQEAEKLQNEIFVLNGKKQALENISKFCSDVEDFVVSKKDV